MGNSLSLKFVYYSPLMSLIIHLDKVCPLEFGAWNHSHLIKLHDHILLIEGVNTLSNLQKSHSVGLLFLVLYSVGKFPIQHVHINIYMFLVTSTLPIIAFKAI